MTGTRRQLGMALQNVISNAKIDFLGLWFSVLFCWLKPGGSITKNVCFAHNWASFILTESAKNHVLNMC